MSTPDLNALSEDLTVIWGAENIGKVIGLNKRQVFHLLETRQLKGATKVASRWCITRQNLMANFEPNCAAKPAWRQLLDELSPEERQALLVECE
jgi:hypothetical protein